MDTSKPTYLRLPGTGYRREVPGWAILLLFFVIGIFVLLLRGRRVQLWQGKEHLLVVEWDGYREYYRRFDYRDVQGFMVRKTVEGKVVNGILVGICMFFGILAVAVPAEARIVMLVLAGIFGALLAGNVLSGPTCECRIFTAVQAEVLPSLSRLPRAHKVFDRLRPLIAAAQGQLTPEEVPARIQQWLADNGRDAAATATGAGYVADAENVPPGFVGAGDTPQG